MNGYYDQYGNYTNAQQNFSGSGSGTITTGNVTFGGQYNQPAAPRWLALQQLMQSKEQKPMNFSGNKPIVICGGECKEAKDMDDAQAIAESLAHSKSADAYILKPVKKVAPKRDVVTTDL